MQQFHAPFLNEEKKLLPHQMSVRTFHSKISNAHLTATTEQLRENCLKGPSVWGVLRGSQKTMA